jgi:hypothetical protein
MPLDATFLVSRYRVGDAPSGGGRGTEVATKFVDKIDSDAGMNASQLVVEYCGWRKWKHRLVPNTGIDVDAERAVAV